ncbi:hypothetical protein SLA2020_264310 [Shorea laevis]
MTANDNTILSAFLMSNAQNSSAWRPNIQNNFNVHPGLRGYKELRRHLDGDAGSEAQLGATQCLELTLERLMRSSGLIPASARYSLFLNFIRSSTFLLTPETYTGDSAKGETGTPSIIPNVQLVKLLWDDKICLTFSQKRFSPIFRYIST